MMKIIQKYKLRFIISFSLLILIVCSLFYFYYISTNNNDESTVEKVGTNLNYIESDGTQFKLGGEGNLDEYRNSKLPDLLISKVENQIWTITENDKSTDSNINITLTLKNQKAILVLSFSEDKKNLLAGVTCFKEDEVSDLSKDWSREIMYDVNREQIGNLYMKQGSYNIKGSENYNNNLVTFKKQESVNSNKLNSEDEYSSCSTSVRMNPTDKFLNNLFGNSLVRIFTINKSTDLESLLLVDDIVKNTAI